MIAKAERKEAARQFKERKPLPGIYALSCRTTGHTWIDSSPNLDAAQNSQFFQLRQRLHRNRNYRQRGTRMQRNLSTSLYSKLFPKIRHC
jgi:hypothetical protein